jgi:hypothetical protein
LTHPRPPRRIVLLGRDHDDYGAFVLVRLAENTTACAISVGSDPESPSLAGKGDPLVPNEDALFAAAESSLSLMAVADAHFGWQSSHELIEGLAAASDELPRLPGELEERVATLPPRYPPVGSSTLLVAVHDRSTGSGFGLSFGDSSLVLVGPDGARRLNVKSDAFVSAHHPTTLQASEGYAFRFLTRPGELLLAFTDGVDECHYRSPGTSIRTRHLAGLFGEVGADPETYARRLVELALRGVEGRPGGQDNVALVVSATGGA